MAASTSSNMLNLLDLVTQQGNDALTGLIEDVMIYAPEFAQFPVIRKSGTSYKIVSRNQLPQSGFRQVNQGIGTSKSGYKQQVKEMFPVDVIINVDELIVKGDDESAGGDILTKEAQGALQSVINTLGTQIWYGTTSPGDPNGFSGLRAQCTNSIGAGGTSNTTSAYLVWLHPWGVNLPVGNKGEIAMIPWFKQQVVVTNPGTTGTSNLMAWVSNINCFIGLTVGSDYSVFAITGLSQPGTLTYPLTDKLGSQLISYIPMMRRQGLMWFMNRNALYQLQQSRSTIAVSGGGSYWPAGAGGGPAWSPTPDNLGGYPIVVTDSIINTESN